MSLVEILVGISRWGGNRRRREREREEEKADAFVLVFPSATFPFL